MYLLKIENEKWSLEADRKKDLASGAFLIALLDSEDAAASLAFEYVLQRDVRAVFLVEKYCFSVVALLPEEEDNVTLVEQNEFTLCQGQYNVHISMFIFTEVISIQGGYVSLQSRLFFY